MVNIAAPVLATIAFVSCLALAGVCYATGQQPPEQIYTLAGVALGVIGGVSIPATAAQAARTTTTTTPAE